MATKQPGSEVSLLFLRPILSRSCSNRSRCEKSHPALQLRGVVTVYIALDFWKTNLMVFAFWGGATPHSLPRGTLMSYDTWNIGILGTLLTVRWGLHDFGVELDEEQSGILFDKYDRDCSGLVE